MLPRVVYQMCVHGALIVGSQAKGMAEDVEIEASDYDLLVPLEHWQTIALLIPASARPNKFGGWRFKTGSIEVDVWPDTLQNYLANCRSKLGGAVYAVDYINNRVYSSQVKEVEG